MEEETERERERGIVFAQRERNSEEIANESVCPLELSAVEETDGDKGWYIHVHIQLTYRHAHTHTRSF